ncbi:hypothetical protein [Streptomyces albipurpureus]|nr:hypothetical protein [Streptomyces sp. CWNU-1]
MSRRRFYVLLTGLSPEAMFRRMAGDELSIVDDPDQIRAALRS